MNHQPSIKEFAKIRPIRDSDTPPVEAGFNRFGRARSELFKLKAPSLQWEGGSRSEALRLSKLLR